MPVTVIIVSLLLKTGLAYLLIFGHAGFPEMGALGLATAMALMRYGLTTALLIGVYRGAGRWPRASARWPATSARAG